MFKIFSLSFILLVVGCSFKKDYTRQTHAYQDRFPDYWDSWYHEKSYPRRVENIERRHKKTIKELKDNYSEPENYESDIFFRSTQED
tara:strand:- start:732 stop:992 length:261 start_codon:yes stop_codon:yes gene_type:complete